MWNAVSLDTLISCPETDTRGHNGSISMNEAKLTKLITNFYNKQISQENAAPDIPALVEYAMENGLESLNSMLMNTYGEKINPSQKVSVFSPADAVKKRKKRKKQKRKDPMEGHSYFTVREKIYKFYEKHDKKQLKILEDLVGWVENHGLTNFNKKLQKKYNNDLSSIDLFLETTANRNDIVLSHKFDAVSEKELKDFFSAVDSTKVDVIHALHLWTMEIGRDGFNKTLDRRYGLNLESYKLFQRPVEPSMRVSAKTIPGVSKLRGISVANRMQIPAENPRLRRKKKNSISKKAEPFLSAPKQAPSPPSQKVDKSSNGTDILRRRTSSRNMAKPGKSDSGPEPYAQRKGGRFPGNSSTKVSNLLNETEAKHPLNKGKAEDWRKPSQKFNRKFFKKRSTLLSGSGRDAASWRMPRAADDVEDFPPPVPQTYKKPAPPPKSVVNKRKTACDNFVLDLLATSYGECLNCGMNRTQHNKKTPRRMWRKATL